MTKSATMLYGIIISGLIVLASCRGGSASGTPGEKEGNPELQGGPAQKLIEFVEPPDNTQVTYGNEIKMVVGLLGKDIPDSVRFYYDGILVKTVIGEPWEANVTTSGSRLGKVPVKAVAYRGNGRPHSVARFVNVFSDIIPRSSDTLL